MALHVGQDVDGGSAGGGSAAELRQHIAGCPSCRQHWYGLQQSQRALRSPQTEVVSRGSLWPGISARLPARREPSFNGWIPALAMAAACLAVFALSANPSAEPVRDRPPIPVLQVDAPTIHPGMEFAPRRDPLFDALGERLPQDFRWSSPPPRGGLENTIPFDGPPRLWPAGASIGR